VRTHFFFGKTQISFPFLLIFLLLLQIAQVATVCDFLRKFCGFFRYCPARSRSLAGAIKQVPVNTLNSTPFGFTTFA
jgi:hypothetical protein